MSSTFNSCNASKLGFFVESPLGFRNAGSTNKHLLATFNGIGHLTATLTTTAIATFVAVGEGGAVMFSEDGISWGAGVNSVVAGWQSVAWNGSVFCAVANSGGGQRVITSSDGINWTGRNAAANLKWEELCWDGTVFCAVASDISGTQRVMTSPTGVTWTLHTDITTGLSNWQAVAAGGGIICAIGNGGNNRSMSSSDHGVTWTVQGNIATAWESLDYSPALGRFTSVTTTAGQKGRASNVPINWITVTTATSTDAVRWSPDQNKFAALGVAAPFAWSSADGITFSAGSIAAAQWAAVCWSHVKNKWVGVSATTVTGSAVATSTDGVNWTLSAGAGAGVTWRGVACNK